MKKTFYTEIAYVLGIIFLAFGTALMEWPDFGMSMVVAPAYILHLKISQYLPFFTFGMAEYSLQFFLIILLMIFMRKIKKGYAFSFVTAVIYGLTLDFCMYIVGRALSGISASSDAGQALSGVPAASGTGLLALKCAVYVLGMVVCALGVAFLFHTYFAPEAYELVVKEVSVSRNIPISKVKTVYDLTSLAISVALSFAFFGWMHFEGVKLGTLITALVNGWMIGKISGAMESRWEFTDRLGLRKYFD